MKQKKTIEDYLKTVYMLSRKGDVHGVNIAEALGVSRPTVSVSLRSLEEGGYLYLAADKTVHLTDSGEELARSIYEKHETIKELLVRFGVSEETAARDACEMEHSVSPESYSALKRIALESIAFESIALDGAALKSVALNGVAPDGVALDGAALKSVAPDGVVLDGIALDGVALKSVALKGGA